MENRGKDRAASISWRIQMENGRDENGKRKRLSVTIHGTPQESRAERARLLTKVTGSLSSRATMLCKDYFEQWLEHARTITAASTFRRYRQIVEKELIPAFGKTKLADLTPMRIQGFLGRSLARKRRRKSGGELSARTVLHFYRVLKRALGQAVRWGLVPRNACDQVDPPRAEQVEMKARDERQLLGLFAVTEGTRQHVPVVLAAVTGMRLGEILALKWSDIDLDHRECQVVRSVQKTDEGLSFKTPEDQAEPTDGPPAGDGVTASMPTAPAERGRPALGPGYQDLDLFRRPDGSICRRCSSPVNFRRTIVARLQHPLSRSEHTHASALKAGVPVKVVSERLGQLHRVDHPRRLSHSFPECRGGRGQIDRAGQASVVRSGPVAVPPCPAQEGDGGSLLL